MGATSSLIGPSPSKLVSSLDRGDERSVVRTLEAHPGLLTTPTARLFLKTTTPLHVACKRKRFEAVQEVLLFLTSSPLAVVREALRPYCRRANLSPPASVPEGIWMAVNMANKRGMTPLMYACRSGCPELVKLLLAHGADPWSCDHASHRTALHYAAIGCSAACIKVLLKELPPGAQVRYGVRYVDARSDCGLTALHYAVYLGDLAAVHELLRHGPNLNAATSSDVLVTCEAASTPLHFAAVRGNTEAARELLAYYARRMVADPGSLEDPRSLQNSKEQLPWQVALLHHPANRALATLLHPIQSIQDALAVQTAAAGSDADPRVGPPTLAAIAAAALKAKLEAEVRSVECGQVVAAAGTASTTLQSGMAVAVVSLPSQPPGVVKAATAEGCRPAATPEAVAMEKAALERAAAERVGGSQAAVQPAAAAGAAAAGKAATIEATDPYNRFSDASCCSGGGCDVTGNPLADDADLDGVCGVCFAAPQAVAPAGCGHGVCLECAAKLCRGIRSKPLRCPFCRKRVAGFIVFAAAGGAADGQAGGQAAGAAPAPPAAAAAAEAVC